ncbi:DEAD/DEAH box helicase [Paenibacillus sp. AK121]|uniref:DEAD/DEAH box helicase n=1 Tax=Paenibacillus sp. AK121 TaxID=2849670 RepID=UPI001C238BD9|nr:DEAD/DEAH box helicase [Paenibacillus sp. AK121]MBU9705494.1 DEAD/DEAH box helicase [Paenibacillus sp. AK121]
MSFESLIYRMEYSGNIDFLIKKIKKMEIQLEFFNQTDEELSGEETRILLESANILAGSVKIKNKQKALNIATTLPLIKPSNSIVMASSLILRKLGNYPGIKLLEDRNKLSNYKRQLNGMALFEAHVFENANTRNLSGKDYLLTNFQKRVVDMIEEEVDGISISAPTSAGKSFVYLKVLLDKIVKQKGTTAIYIVPTRALIKQVMNDFLSSISEMGLKNIFVGCSSEIEVLIEHPERSNILVLTQERLYQLCNRKDVNRVKTNIIVVDEAHNIQYGGRGVLLENAVKFSRLLWPETKILFSSPLVKNPQKLLETFEFENGANERDNLPLVRQNIITVKLLEDTLLVTALFNKEEIAIGKKSYTYSGSKTISKVLSSATLDLWNNQTSIVYSNEPMLSTDVIRELYNNGNFPLLDDVRLNDFADFIEEYITESYELANFIRRGLAFHFGSLPAIIRSGIEDLFKLGLLKIVSCTSTLLEGVNMPAKNIFVYKPKKGRKNPIDNLSFWNLVGRAGRIGNDFSGNVICIELESWVTNPVIGERYQDIIPSSEIRLVKEPEKFKDFIKSENPKRQESDDYNEQLFSLVIKEHLLGERLENSLYSTDQNLDILKEIDTITGSTINAFKPPTELLNKNPGVMPQKINALWDFLVDNKSEIDYLCPVFPLNESGYERFDLIVNAINVFFNDSLWTEKQVKRITTVGDKWMKGVSLTSLIFYDRQILNREQREITKHVKDQIEFINKTIRYQIVKYTQTYIEVLKTFLISINRREDSEKIINISAYLEYGACATSALEFMAIGLHREAAIKLSRIMGFHDNITTDTCIEWLKNLDVESIDVANYLKKEIYGLQMTL